MRALSVLIGLTLAMSAQAQTGTKPDPLPATVSPAAVLSVVTADWNNDGWFDRAVLVEGEDAEANLYIYLSAMNADGTRRRDLVVQKPDALWRGILWGTQPSLAVTDKGALLLKSGNDSVGRSRWSQVATVVYRNSEFIVAGLTFTSRDTLDPNAGGTCDLNLLTGQGKRNGKAITIPPKATRLVDWQGDDGPPKICDQ
ncbi:hypothetical protein [Microvirga antarctica]|uniref:hypothetical protein n=1 Tax=Microvirga antarctica TaxID=2819233 RepID=UPI001B30FC98|nr:hypothetical protein [Microvirga antarctica]